MRKTTLVLIFTFLVFGAYAQTDVVNSLGASNNTSHAASDASQVWSHAFTIGSSDITLSEVKLNAFVGAGNATMRVTIRDNQSVSAGTEIEDLGTKVITSTSEDNTETWTSSTNPTLSANTTYYVHYIYVSGSASSARWDASTTAANTGTLGSISANNVYQNGSLLAGFFLDMAITGSLSSSGSGITSSGTINFNTTDNTNLGPVANDGEGGSSDISGVVFNLFIANGSGVATGGDIFFDNSGSGYEGLSSSGNPGGTGFAQLVLKTNDGSEFDFNGFSAAEYGFTVPILKVEAFKDGSLIGSTTVSLGSFGTPTYGSANFADGTFGDVDEIRISENSSSSLFATFDSFEVAPSVAGSSGTTGTVAITETSINPGSSFNITVTDADLNTNTGVAETVDVEVNNTTTGENETITLTETGINTGVFTASLGTTFGTTAGTNDTGNLNVQAGDGVTVTYTDANPSATPTDNVTINGGTTGTIDITEASINPGSSFNITVTDADLNTNTGVAETVDVEVNNTTTGENETITLTETGINTGIFTASLATSFGTTAGTNDSGNLNVQAADGVTATYADAFTASGGTASPGDNVTITASFAASISSQTNVSCNGGTDGSLTVTVSNGTANYSYSWSNGSTTNGSSSTTNTISSLTAGTYTVTVTDGLGATATSSGIITEPTTLVAATVVDSNVTCNGFIDGGATASATGGTGAYTYVWSNGATTASITGMGAGTYSVTITDANGCTDNSSVTITEPATLVAAAVVDSNVTCNGFIDGGATSSATGGTMPYAYAWSNGATTASITGMGAGTYNITITDANGCTDNSSVTITEPAVLTAATVVDSNVTCNGFIDGGASSSATGGTMPYAYAWSNGATTASITGMGAGTYSVTITDVNGCTDNSSVTITEPAVLTAATIVDSNVTCNGFIDGGASSSATGGTMPYAYAWSNGATTASITGMGAGTYSVTITDANGCTDNSSVTITQPDALAPDSASVAANITISGNWGGWLNSSTGIVESNPTSFVFVGNLSGAFYHGWTQFDISGIDDNATIDSVVLELSMNNTGASALQTMRINKVELSNYGPYGSPNPTAYADLGTDTYTTIDLTTAGTFSGINLGSSAGTDLQAALSKDTFQLAFSIDNPTDWKRFSSNLNNIKVYYRNAPQLTFNVCNGNVISQISSFKTPLGGSGDFSYQWQQSSDASTWTTAAGQSDSSLYIGSTALHDTVYFRRIAIDDVCNDSIFSKVVTVNVPDSLGSTLSTNNISCNGLSDGSISASVSGGFPPYTYAWSNSATTASISSLAAGAYSVTVTDANGCTTTASTTATEPVALMAATVVDSNVTCNGFTDGGASSSATGGTTPYTYVWSNGATTASITGVGAGTYSITITDANGCTDNSSVTITEPATLAAATVVDSNLTCNGSMDGGASSSASGGTAPYTYAWSNGATTASITGVSAGTYNITITDANGCTDNSSVTITEPAVLMAAAIVDSNVTCNGFTDGGASSSASGGTMPYTYAWSNGATTASITGLSAGTYNITITDANGCTDNSSVTITEPAVLMAAAIVDSNVTCNGFIDGGATASATGGTMPYAYVWSNGATTASITGMGAGTYSVTITDANGCTDNSSVTITEPAVLMAAAIVDSNVTCNGFIDGGASSSATGGTMPYTYAWSNGATTASITGVSAGTYNITITDANGCTDNSSVTITEPATLMAAAIVDSNVTCNGFIDGGASSSATGGTMPYTYAWSNGATTASITGMGAGTYSVTITDANGCTDNSSVTITEPAVLIAATVVDSNVTCNGFIDGGASSSATGGTMPYTYAWSNGATTASITGMGAGTYSVTITDANGCTDNSSVTITEPAVLMAATVVDSNVTCNGFTDGGATSSATGGTMPYTYAWSNGATTASITGMGAGTYSVTITDANGCTDNSSVTITEPAALSASISPFEISCAGAQDASLKVNASGGTGSLSYLWSTGSTSDSIFNLAPGTYTVTVSDQNACTASISSTVIEPDTFKIQLISQRNVFCKGDSTGLISITGTIDTIAFQGFEQTTNTTSTFTSGIVSPRGLAGVEYQISNGAAGRLRMPAGTDFVRSGNNAATIDAQFNGAFPSPINYLIVSFDLSSNAGASGLEASFWLMGHGDEPDVNDRVWVRGSNTDTWIEALNYIASSFPTGQYQQFTFPLDSILSANGQQISSTTQLRFGQEDNFTAASITSSDGLSIDDIAILRDNSESYLWSNGDTTSTLSNVPIGTYSVVATSINGCKDSATYVITEPAQELAGTISSITDVACKNEATGAIQITYNGGTPPYRFSWSTGSTDTNLTGLTAGTYTVTITDSLGCNISLTDSVEEPAERLAFVKDTTLAASSGSTTLVYDETFTQGQTYCPGDSQYDSWKSFRQSIDTTASFSSIKIIGSELAGGKELTDPNLVKQLAVALAKGTEVTVTDGVDTWRVGNSCITGCAIPGDDIELNANNNGNDCSCSNGPTLRPGIGNANWGGLGASTCNAATQNMRVELVQGPGIPNLVATDVICKNDATGAIKMEITGGVRPYTYSWSNGTTDSTLQNVLAGTYTVTVTDAVGCQLLDSATVEEPDSVLTLSVQADSNVTCYNLADGGASAIVSGGVLPYTYAWSTGDSTATITGLSAGTYTITVTDSVGCVRTLTQEITQPDSLYVVLAVDSNASCLALNDAGISSTVFGGTMPYTYSWSNTASTADVSNIGVGTYMLTVTDSNGCSATASATIVVEDTIRPNVLTQAKTAYLGSNGMVSITVSDIDNGSSDLCGLDSLWLDKTAFVCGELGANTVTLTALDVNGNQASATAIVTVLDTITPVAKAQNLTAYLDANGSVTITPQMADNGSSDNCQASLVYTLSQSTFNCSDEGLNVETLTVTDSAGNSASATFLIDIKDTISPILISKNITVQLGASGQASIAPSQLDSASSDNCANQLFYSASKTSFSCADLGSNTVTLTITDGEGNSTTGTTIVTVEDNIIPIAQAQGLTVQLDANGQASITAAMVNNGSSDNCTIDSIWVSRTSFSCSDIGQSTILFTVQDQSGNTNSTNVVITVEDNVSPTMTTNNLTVYLDANGSASITAMDVDNGSTDNCAISSLSVTPASFGCSDVGANTVTLTGTDASGNSSTATATVTLVDTISPSVSVQNLTVMLDASGAASIAVSDIDNGSTDNCSIASSVLSQTSFGCTDIGTNTVTLTVTDVNGNASSANAVVTVQDQMAPTVVTQSITVYLDATGNASITTSDVDNGSTDNCSIASLSLDNTSFTCSDLGANVVTLSATDASSNTASQTATVTVLDTVSPTMATNNLTVYLDANGSASITAMDVDNGSTDNCAISSLSVTPASFGCSDVGANTVTLTGTDASGNSSTATATVTLVDTISPSVSVQNLTVMLDASGAASIAVSDIDNGSTDNCSIASSVLSQTSFGCADIGTNTVTLTVTDVNGNASSANAVVTVQDQMAPTVVTQNITVYLDATGNASITAADVDNGSLDNCSLGTSSLDISTFDCADLGQNLVSLTVNDNNGNSASATAFVTILDTISPSISNLPGTITAYVPAGQCATTVQWPAIVGSDNCSSTFVTTSQVNGGLFQKGTSTVNVSVTDGNGNGSTGSFTITVLDTISPSFSNVPSSFNITSNANSCDAVVTWINPIANDNCGVPTVTSTHTSGGTFPVGNTVVTYTATDADNNSTSISFTVSVTDAIDPIISGTPSNIVQTADAGSCDAVVNFTAPTVSDNCTGATLSASHTSGSTFSVGTTTVSFTATDAAGNTATSSFTVTIEDNEKPVVLSVPASDTVGVCNAAYVYPLPTASDNCGAITVTQVSGLPSGNVFPAGVTQNTFRISDAAGNDTLVSFTIVIIPQGQAQLPNVLEVCGNDPAFDITLGQNIVWSGNGVVNETIFDPSLAPTGRQTLSYVFTDDYGCQVSGSISITVLPVPSAPVIVQLSSTTLGTQASYSTYQWYRNGILIPGATLPTYSYTQGGNYQVTVGNISGCQVYGDGYVVGNNNGGSIGIVENRLEDLGLYPNPTAGSLTIDLGIGNTAEDVELTLFTIGGKRVLHQSRRSDEQGKVTIDLTNLPKAPYFLKVVGNGQSVVRKVIKH